MANEKNKPIYSERIRSIKTAVWKHEEENGTRYTVKTVRTYRVADDKRKGKNDDGWRETEYLDYSDLPAALKLQERAFNFMADQQVESE